MAKIAAFFLTPLLFFQSLFFIGGRAIGKVTLVAEEKSYSVEAESVTAVWHNATLKQARLGPSYALEAWDDGKWVNIPSKEPILPGSSASMLKPFQSMRTTFNLSRYWLPVGGRFRIAAQCNGGVAYAEFKLTGEGKVTLKTEFATYPVGTREITATLFNGSPAVFSYTVGYRIDKFIDGEWVTVGPNVGFITLMVNLWPGCAETLECELSCDDPMEAGRYRIAVRDVYGEFSLV